MKTDDGFEVTLEETDVSFMRDSYILRVTKVIKFSESQLVPKELIEAGEFDIQELLDEMKERINDKVNL